MEIKEVGILALETIFGNWVGTLTGGSKNVVEDIQIKKAFSNCGEVIRQFENDGKDSFGEKIKIIFNKENLESIYKKMKKESTYDYIYFLRNTLKNICKEYEIEADIFIEEFIKMFNYCIREYDSRLYAEIYQGERWHENQEEHSLMIAKIDDLIEVLIQNGTNSSYIESLPRYSSEDTTSIEVDDDAIYLEWKISPPKSNGFYATDDEKRNAMSVLTNQWKEEREKVPSWYIVPRAKRYVLTAYTENEELLYAKECTSLEERFDFAYELVWRYETAFISYTMKLQEEIRNVWNQIDLSMIKPEKVVCWFFIGQALLREYREDLNIDNWKEVYKKLWENRECMINGEAELSLERVKLLFMQMRLSDTREKLLVFQCDSSAWGVRLQIAGMKAECGLLEEAMDTLIKLENDLLLIMQDEPDRRKHIMYKSVLAGTYYLQSFVLQGIKPFQKEQELVTILDKLHEYTPYFDFDKEKESAELELYRKIKKENKAVAFEINKDTKITTFSNRRFSEIYDFYRVLDRVAIPLHIGYTRLLDDDESVFVKGLLEGYQYLGWFMLMRFGSTKTTEKVVSRKQFSILCSNDSERLKKVFTYVYDAVDGNIASIKGCDCYDQNSNAYGHMLSNGLEILKRLTSITNIYGQKKVLLLMCKLIDADVIREYGVLNAWIRHVMHVTEDRVRATMLNELLTCATKERTSFHGEKALDPFDVFGTFEQAYHFYQSADIDSDIVDNMLKKAYASENEKEHIIPRLGMLYEWKLLSTEQSEKLADLLWSEVNEDTLLTYDKGYYFSTLLRWPSPSEVDVISKIKQTLLDKENFIRIQNQSLSAITFGDNIYLYQIQNLNANVSDFWEIREIELLMNGFIDCWKAVKNKISEEKHSAIYKEECYARMKTLIDTICSFSRKQILKMDVSILQKINEMVLEMKEYNIDAIEVSAAITSETNLSSVIREVINGLRSTRKECVDSSIHAAEIILRQCNNQSMVQDILYEILVLCLYRKEPGLKQCLYVLHSILYSMADIEFSEDMLMMINEILDNIDMHTNYEKNGDKSEKDIKNIVKIRIACANFAYQLYQYQHRKQIPYSTAVLNWKDICRGKKSGKEFAEVKRCWLENNKYS